jgi:DNA-binding response OmpR family regulator
MSERRPLNVARTTRRVLVVDDEPKIADVVASYLQKAGFEALRAGSGEEGLRLFDRERPHLVILDLMLPDMPGKEVCRRLRARSRVPVIMLTAKVQDADAVAGLEIGADDYVTKPFSPRQLIARVEAVLRRSLGDVPLAGNLSFDDGDLVIDAVSRVVRRGAEAVDLTAREYAILTLLSASPGRVFSRAEIVERALGGEYDGFERTVDAHVKNLRRKLEADPRQPRYVLTVHGMGYRFAPGSRP